VLESSFISPLAPCSAGSRHACSPTFNTWIDQILLPTKEPSQTLYKILYLVNKDSWNWSSVQAKTPTQWENETTNSFQIPALCSCGLVCHHFVARSPSNTPQNTPLLANAANAAGGRRSHQHSKRLRHSFSEYNGGVWCVCVYIYIYNPTSADYKIIYSVATLSYDNCYANLRDYNNSLLCYLL
jgi:hypothetical protein